MKNLSFFRRFRFAANGIYSTLRTEKSFQFQAIASIMVICVLVFLRAAPSWWAILLLTTGGVLSAELFNTAMERLSDGLHPEMHPMIKLAKDSAAGAVLILSITSLGVFVAFLIGTLRG